MVNFSFETQQLNLKLNKLKAEKETYTKQKQKLENRLTESKEHLDNLNKARALVYTAAKQTQEKIRIRLTHLVTLALNSIPFCKEYKFEAEFVEKRNQSECEFWLVTPEGNRIKPLKSSGGGVADIVSFALRMAIWSINKNRPVFILDEPFKGLSMSYHDDCALMMKEVSKKLGVQIIMITHSERLKESADHVFIVKEGKVTKQ